MILIITIAIIITTKEDALTAMSRSLCLLLERLHQVDHTPHLQGQLVKESLSPRQENQAEKNNG